MTHRQTIYDLSRLFGRGSVLKEKKKAAHYKQSYRWVVTTQQAARVLRLLRPYLRTKKKQAILLVEIAEEMEGMTSNRTRLSPRRQQWQDRRLEQIRRFNRA